MGEGLMAGAGREYVQAVQRRWRESPEECQVASLRTESDNHRLVFLLSCSVSLMTIGTEERVGQQKEMTVCLLAERLGVYGNELCLPRQQRVIVVDTV